jgi:hypothetical protein
MAENLTNLFSWEVLDKLPLDELSSLLSQYVEARSIQEYVNGNPTDRKII